MSHTAKNISSFTQQDVAYLLKNAHVKARIPGLRVLMAPALQEHGRILVVTPRHSGNSVKRNLIRRRLKSLFHQEQFSAHKYDCVVLVKKEGIATSFEDLKQLLTKAFVAIHNEQIPVNPVSPS